MRRVVASKLVSLDGEPAVWERRIRAPRLVTWGLETAATSWAAEVVGRGVVLATTDDTVEVHAFDVDTHPARLRRVTNRPHGTIDGAISPDGAFVFWFDDSSGDETGRWVREPFEGGEKLTMLAQLPPGWPGGVVPLLGGGLIVGSYADEFTLAVAGADGAGHVVFRQPAFTTLRGRSLDGALALLQVEPLEDAVHHQAQVVDLMRGEVVATLSEIGQRVAPVSFHPGDADAVLVLVERNDFPTPAVWTLRDGKVSAVPHDLPGTVRAAWSADGRCLILASEVDGETTLHAYDIASGATRPIGIGSACTRDFAPRPDGSVHAVRSSSATPPKLVRICPDTDEANAPEVLLDPSNGITPAAPSAEHVHADGPGGRVHGLVREPLGWSRPHAALFVIHGGPGWHLQDEWHAALPAFTDAGYAVITVDYRGSDGHGAAWRDALYRDVGAIECEDVAAVFDRLVSEGIIDPARVAISGTSWGGFVVLHALGRQPERWRAGIAHVPLADWELAWELTPEHIRVLDVGLLGGRFEDIPEAYRAASPITYVDRVTAPVLITAGEADPRCPIAQVDAYVQRLTARGHEVRYERRATGHLAFDLESIVRETQQTLEFLTETCPPASLGTTVDS